MVWSDYDYAEPKIMRADLTGDNQRVLVRSRLFFGVPLYLIIDYSESRVYWTDLHYAFTLVRSVDLNGQNFRRVKYLHHSYFPYDLAIFQNQLYWVDESMDGIAWFPFKNSGVNSVTVVDGLSPHNLEGVVVSDPSRQPTGTFKSIRFKVKTLFIKLKIDVCILSRTPFSSPFWLSWPLPTKMATV